MPLQQPPAQRRVTQFPMKELRGQTKVPPTKDDRPSAPKRNEKSLDIHHVQSKKRAPSADTEPSSKKMRGPFKNLALGEAVQSNKSLESVVVIRRESPWETFTVCHAVELDMLVQVAVARVRPSRLLAVRQFPEHLADRMIHLSRNLQHPNIISFNDCFIHDGAAYMVNDHIHTTLNHLVGCDAPIGEMEIAAILAQVLDGLIFLSINGLEHQDLKCSDVLVTQLGEVKLGKIETCQNSSRNQIPQYCRLLRALTADLMQGYTNDDDEPDDINISNWPPGVRDFWLSLTPEVSIQRLRSHPLFTKRHWWKGHLMGLVSYAMVTSFSDATYIKQHGP